MIFAKVDVYPPGIGFLQASKHFWTISILQLFPETPQACNQTVLSFETFAMTVQDLDPDSFQGQTFVVDLGPVEEAVNNTGVIDQDALMTANDYTADNRSDIDSLSEDTENSTASLRLSPLILKECPTTNRSLRQRLSYSVFLSDVLFLPENRSTNQV